MTAQVNDVWTARIHAARPGPLPLYGDRVGRSLRILAQRAGAARRPRRHPRRARGGRARSSTQAAARAPRRRCRRASRDWAALLRAVPPTTARADAACACKASRSTRRARTIVERYADRSLAASADARADGRPQARAASAAGTNCFRARPRPSTARTAPSATSQARLPYVAEHGLRRAVLAAHPPDRPHQPQGRQQRARVRNPTTSAAPGRSARRRAATRTVLPELGTLEDFRRLVCDGARTRASRSRSTSPFSARPIIPTSAPIRNGSSTGPTAACSTRRTRRRNIRTSIPSISKPTTGARLWDELKSVVEFWIEQGVRIFRVDNPHTKPFAFWEWLIGEIKRAIPT